MIRTGEECLRIIQKPEALVIDADDTLWENNIYFENVINLFLEMLESHGADHARCENILRKIQRENVGKVGYGVESFKKSILDTFDYVADEGLVSMTPEKRHGMYHDEFLPLIEAIRNHEIRLMPGVAKMLPYLRENYLTFLMTKGDEAEQRSKVARSGLSLYFNEMFIVREKDVGTYEYHLNYLGLSPENTMVIGNSPRSDINPARLCGMHTVLIPNSNTWKIEIEGLVDAEPETIICDTFFDLKVFL